MTSHVTMLENRTGSPDGIRVHRYTAGETYRVSDDLAKIFIDQGWAEAADAPAAVDDTPEPDGLDALDDEQLAARVLEADPQADPDDVAAAIADNRTAVVDALRTHAAAAAAKPKTRARKPKRA